MLNNLKDKSKTYMLELQKSFLQIYKIINYDDKNL